MCRTGDLCAIGIGHKELVMRARAAARLSLHQGNNGLVERAQSERRDQFAGDQVVPYGMEAAQAITVAAAAALITVGVPMSLLVVALRGGLMASWTAGAAIIAACSLVGCSDAPASRSPAASSTQAWTWSGSHHLGHGSAVHTRGLAMRRSSGLSGRCGGAGMTTPTSGAAHSR
jgi:hypothetical protein